MPVDLLLRRDYAKLSEQAQLVRNVPSRNQFPIHNAVYADPRDCDGLAGRGDAC